MKGHQIISNTGQKTWAEREREEREKQVESGKRQLRTLGQKTAPVPVRVSL